MSRLVTGCEHVHSASRAENDQAADHSMTILVTGGAGYIGSHMVHALRDAGERVLVLDNLSTGFDWAVPATAPLIVADTGDEARVRAVLSEHAVDTIIHFAASVVVPDSVRDPL